MDDKITLCLFTVTYKRPELTEYIFSYYMNIKNELSDICDMHLICVGSDGKAGELLANKYEFDYTEYPNEPVSQKHNKGTLECKKYNPDGIIYVGSDDILSIEFFKFYIQCIKDSIDFCGILDIFFLTKNRLGYWGGYKLDSGRHNEPVGPGKFYSKNLMNLLNWQPWGNVKLNKGLDKVVNNNLKKLKYNNKLVKCSEIGGILVDIKTKINITDINNFKYDKECDINELNKYNVEYKKIDNLLILKK